VITSDPIQTIDMLLSSRGVKDYHMDFYTLLLLENEQITPANRGWHFLVSKELPAGLEIISETHALKVGETTPSTLQEFTGQMRINVPEGASVDRLDFIRIIPKATDEK
jgi:hypothetical protein